MKKILLGFVYCFPKRSKTPLCCCCRKHVPLKPLRQAKFMRNAAVRCDTVSTGNNVTLLNVPIIPLKSTARESGTINCYSRDYLYITYAETAKFLLSSSYAAYVLPLTSPTSSSSKLNYILMLLPHQILVHVICGLETKNRSK